jgi:hypothetical protein
MIPVRHDAVEVDFDGQRARLRVSGVDVFGDHDFGNSLSPGLGLPMIGFNAAIPGTPRVRAKVSFDVEWDGALATAQIENHAQQFKGTSLALAPRLVGPRNNLASNFSRIRLQIPKQTSFPCWDASKTEFSSAKLNCSGNVFQALNAHGPCINQWGDQPDLQAKLPPP